MNTRVDNQLEHHDLWKHTHKWPGSISISWLFVKDVPNVELFHFKNPLNENRPIYIGRDCQEVYPRVGQKLLAFFETYQSKTRLFDDFHIYDE